MPTPRRHGSVLSTWSGSSGSLRSMSSAAPAPATTTGSSTRTQPATSPSPESTPCPIGPSWPPQRARASSTPSVTRPTAHRSRDCTRQKGGRAGAFVDRDDLLPVDLDPDALALLACFFAADLAGARVEAPPRVLVTTVQWSLRADQAVCGDTPPVEIRTYVRYRRARGTPVDDGGERGGRPALPRRAGGRAPRREGRLRRDGVPPRERPPHHQHGAA